MENAIVLNESSKEIIRKYNSDITDVIGMTNASQILELQGYHEIQNAFANFLSSAIENKLNEKFHSSLSTLEKNGLVSSEKIFEHEKNVKRAKAIAGGVTTFAFEAAPLIVDYFSNHFSKENIKEFVIGWTAYINGKFDKETSALVKGFIEDIGIKIKENEYETIFNKYVNASQLHMSSLTLSKTSQRNLSGYNLSIIVKKLISLCDLSDENIKQRAMEFIVECMRVRMSQAEILLNDSESEQIMNSDFIGFSALGYVSFFKPLINSIDTAKKFAYYDAECDRYSKLRETRKAAIDEAVNLDVVDVMKNIHPTLAKIYVSVGLAKKSLNPNNDTKRIFDIQKIKKAMLAELI